MASYFNHNNTETTRLREKLAEDSLDMLIQWLKDGGNVGIHGKSLGLHFFFVPVTESVQMQPTVHEVEGARSRVMIADLIIYSSMT